MQSALFEPCTLCVAQVATASSKADGINREANALVAEAKQALSKASSERRGLERDLNELQATQDATQVTVTVTVTV